MRALLLPLALLFAAGCGSAGVPGTSTTGGATRTGAGGAASAGTTGGAGGATSSSTSAGTTGGAGGSSAEATSGGSGGAPAPVWGAPQCPAPPEGVSVGKEIGQQLEDVVVKDCDGNDVSLTELCGASALWIFAASGTCPFCKTVSAQQEMIHAAYAARNLASVNILVENGQGNPPDANDCKVWRSKFGQQKVRTFYDPTGAVTALWPEPGTTSMSAFVDHDRLIVSKLVHTSDLVAIMAGIEGALEP
jgi:hypothetical protein